MLFVSHFVLLALVVVALVRVGTSLDPWRTQGFGDYNLSPMPSYMQPFVKAAHSGCEYQPARNTYFLKDDAFPLMSLTRRQIYDTIRLWRKLYRDPHPSKSPFTTHLKNQSGVSTMTGLFLGYLDTIRNATAPLGDFVGRTSLMKSQQEIEQSVINAMDLTEKELQSQFPSQHTLADIHERLIDRFFPLNQTTNIPFETHIPYLPLLSAIYTLVSLDGIEQWKEELRRCHQNCDRIQQEVNAATGRLLRTLYSFKYRLLKIAVPGVIQNLAPFYFNPTLYDTQTPERYEYHSKYQGGEGRAEYLSEGAGTVGNCTFSMLPNHTCTVRITYAERTGRGPYLRGLNICNAALARLMQRYKKAFTDDISSFYRKHFTGMMQAWSALARALSKKPLLMQHYSKAWKHVQSLTGAKVCTYRDPPIPTSRYPRVR